MSDQKCPSIRVSGSPALMSQHKCSINPLQPGVAFLYPLKTSEKLKVCYVFGGYRKATLGCNGFKRRFHCEYPLVQRLYKPYTFELLNWVCQRSLLCLKQVAAKARI